MCCLLNKCLFKFLKNCYYTCCFPYLSSILHILFFFFDLLFCPVAGYTVELFPEGE